MPKPDLCKKASLGWSPSEFLFLEEKNIHVDNFPKPPVEEEEEEEEEVEEEEEPEEEEDEEEWEDEEEDDEEEEDEEEEEISPKKSLADVEGAIPKHVIRKLPNSTIRKVLFHLKKNILMLETENYLYERTIEKLEASEKDLNMKPLPDEEFEGARQRICPSESEEEPENDGSYKGVVPLDVIRLSKDDFFEDLNEEQKEEAIVFFKDVGAIAPSNYDVMHHKYGVYVGTAAEPREFEGPPGEQRTRLNSLILNSRSKLDEKMLSAQQMANNMDETGEAKKGSSAGSQDENFSLGEAKKLSITDRLRFAMEEEEEFIKRFYQHETQALKDESHIQIHIDAHKHAIGILMGIRKDFRHIAKGATGAGLNGKIMADLLTKFRMRMKNQLSVEETRTRISTRKVITQKKIIMEQLKTNKDVGKGVSHIDYEYLLCESAILESEIKGMNNTLSHLKDLTGQFQLVLAGEKETMNKMILQENKMSQELKRRHNLLHHFHQTYVKYTAQIKDANQKMKLIKQRLNDGFHHHTPPQPLDYISLKSSQYELESEVQSLENQLLEYSQDLEKEQRKFARLQERIPEGVKSIEEENEDWLAAIKREVKIAHRKKTGFRRANELVQFASSHKAEWAGEGNGDDNDDDDDDDDWNHPGSKFESHLNMAKQNAHARLTMSIRKSLVQKISAEGKDGGRAAPPKLTDILEQSNERVKSMLLRKSMMPTVVYDDDFEFGDTVFAEIKETVRTSRDND